MAEHGVDILRAMTTRIWTIATAAILGLLSATAAPERSASRVPPAGLEDPLSAAACGKCHTEIHKEWDGRAHQRAWDDPIYQAKLKTKKRPKSCHACHIPDRVLGKRLGRKPATRKDEKSWHEGITCVSCHELDGKIHGPYGAKTAAHESVKDEAFSKAGSIKLCSSCHRTKIDVVYPVAKDFEEAGFADEGGSCVGCHMPKVERHLAVDPETGKPTGEKRKGRSHATLGPNDAEFCGKAFAITAQKKDAKLVVTVANEAGHRVPGLRIRDFHFKAVQKDASGKVLGEDTFEIGGEEPLKAAAQREFPFALKDGATQVEVIVDHHFQEKKVAEVKRQALEL